MITSSLHTTLAIATMIQGAGAPAPADDTPNAVRTLSMIRPDFDEMSDLGKQVYGIQMNATSDNRSGSLKFKSTLTLNTVVENGRIVLEDELKFAGRSMSFELECHRDSFLSTESGSFNVTKGGVEKEATLSVHDGTATVELDTGVQTFDYPAGTLTQAAAFRIIPQLPSEANIEYRFSGYSEMSDVQAKVPQNDEYFSIVCEGDTNVTVGRETIDCTEFTLDTGKEVSFFVDFDGNVRKVVADQGQTVMILIAAPTRGIAAVNEQ